MADIKVLILSSLYPNRINSNLGIFIHNQVRHLRDAGCSVKVISPIPFAPKGLWFNPKWKSYGEIPDHELIDGIDVFYPRYVQAPGAWFHGISCYTMYAGIAKIMRSAIKEFKPDILHAHRATPEGFAGLLIKNRYKIPLVCSLRGSDINVFPYRDKLTMALTKKVISNVQLISVSNTLRTVTESISVPSIPIRVVYNGCATDDFSSDRNVRKIRRGALGIADTDKVLIFVGNLIKTKGVFELLEAFISLSASRRDLYLIMVGKGAEQKKIRNIIESASLENRIILTGKVPHNEISSWLNAADLFVLPTYYEGLPNALLEAMSCGLPVIATRVGGIPEVIEDGRNGVLIEKQNTNALSRAIEYLINDGILAENMGIVGRQLLNDRFSWGHNAADMSRIYGEVINADN
jgi:teichuronic acid biosynthesis glycosyltransferase TuaC